MADTETLSSTAELTSVDLPWNVVVHDDPVNWIRYVTLIIMKIFGYDLKRATTLTLEVHEAGRSIVWSGEREKAEFYVQQLQAHQLKTTLEKVQ